MLLHNAQIHKLDEHRSVVVLLSSCLLYFGKQNRSKMSLFYCLYNLCNQNYWTVHGLSIFAFVSLAVKVKVKVTLEQATKVQRGSIGIVLLFL
jgi:hypothetical protein